MTIQNPLTLLLESEVKQLVDSWYAKLDVHAPVTELLPLLAQEGLEMRFPEATLHDPAAFQGWYSDVTHKFFDEVHTMQELSIKISGEQAEVTLVVNWQAHTWNPPAAKSQWLGFNATQRWIVKRLAPTQQPVIVTYIVDALTPMPGSPGL